MACIRLCSCQNEMKCGEAVLTSTLNLCFGTKIRKIGTCIPLDTAPVLLYKSGVWEGILYTDLFSWWWNNEIKFDVFPISCISVSQTWLMKHDMFHGISTWLLVCFFPTSVFGVGIFFWLRLFLIFAYLYLFMSHLYVWMYSITLPKISVFHVYSYFCFPFIAGVVHCGSPKMSSRTSAIVQIIFFFRPFRMFRVLNNCTI